MYPLDIKNFFQKIHYLQLLYEYLKTDQVKLLSGV